MLIRSQDKKTIANINHVDSICVVKNEIFVYNGAKDSRVMIGEYSSEEKAIKVLDMLQEKYLSRMELDGGFDTVTGCYVQPNYWVLPKVFQMPQDSEVEA